MKIATIDVGTNTALLLIASEEEGRLISHVEAQQFVRLGEGVDAARTINQNALQRLRKALLTYRAEAEAHGVARIIVTGTSASRDASNQEALVDFVRRETGLSYTILSGEEEAQWTFAGAVSAFDDLADLCAVVDIGGGSTEILIGRADAALMTGGFSFRQSLNIGSVRLTERYFPSLPPAPAAVATARSFIEQALQDASVPGSPAPPLIGAAGTLVALTLLHHQAPSWEALGLSSATLSHCDVHGWLDRLMTSSYEDILALNPAVLRGRADVFAAGVLILDTLMQHMGAPRCLVSPRGLRHGVALRFFQEK